MEEEYTVEKMYADFEEEYQKSKLKHGVYDCIMCGKPIKLVEGQTHTYKPTCDCFKNKDFCISIG